MKQFNKGDLVTSNDKYSDVFKKETVYLGTTETSSGTIYHVVGYENESNITTTFIQDNKIELVAIAKYTPIPKFHKGDKAFWGQQEVMIVEERDKDLRYVCYNQVKKILEFYAEKDLLNEEELEKTLEENLPKAEVEEEI